MSKLLKRALKNSIAPAILMIAGKAIGIFGISSIYGLNLDIGNDIGGIFSTQIIYTDKITTTFVNSYSDLLMLIFLAVPTIYLIVKTAIFQSTLSNPKTIAKVARFNIMKWITKDDTTFLKIFIWCAFLWISSAICITNALNTNSYMYIAYIAGTLSFITALGAIKTFEVETNKVYPSNNKYY